MTLFGFFDSTAFSGARDFDTSSWRRIRDGVDQNVASVATSQVNVLEITRQTYEALESKFTKLEDLSRTLKPLGTDLVMPARPAASDIDRQFPEWLDMSGFDVIPMSVIPHNQIVARDIAVEAPFNRAGKGYRDTLVWLAFLEWIGTISAPSGATVYFVTNNTQDFCGPKGDLKPELLAELPSGLTVTVLNRAQDFSQLIELATPPTVEEVVTNYALQFADSTVLFESLDSDLLSWETSVEDATIGGISVEDVEAQLVDEMDGGTELWSVKITADLEITGYVHKSDLPGLDQGLSVSDFDWNSHYAEVQGHQRGSISVDVRIEADGETVDAEIQEISI